MIEARKAKLKILTGRTHPELANEVAERLGVPLTKTRLSTFANGEISCKLDESVRGSDAFIVQSHGLALNDAIMEQMIMIDAAKRASARSITAVCPFLGYARQDRKSSGREPITARLVVDMLANAGADRIMSVDLHSGQIQGFFNGPFDHLIAMPLLRAYIKKHLDISNLVIVSPDAGRVKMAERYSSSLNCGMAIVHKHRSYTKHNTVEAKYLIGDVQGKTCVIADDMIDTAGTVCAAANLLAEHGAKEIYGIATHGVLSDPALMRIEESAFKQVIVTNSLPFILPKKSKVTILSIAPLLGDAIAAVFSELSVSALFDGKNQS
jgi:ribose-phosphate pyrophosphokinase